MFGDESRGCGICGIFSILGVLSDGTYALCGIGESVKELNFGSAEKDKLKDVWNKTQILNEIRDNLPKELKGICGECVMKNRCLGSCIAQNYYREHDLMAPFWFCEAANEMAIFPINRLLAKKIIHETTESKSCHTIPKLPIFFDI
jgi:radical SAM protein with 4Fe4S-binding SPASM domain